MASSSVMPGIHVRMSRELDVFDQVREDTGYVALLTRGIVYHEGMCTTSEWYACILHVIGDERP